MLKFLLGVLSLTPLAGYRRGIGVAALAASALMRHVVCDPTLGASVPFLATTCSAVPAFVLTVLDVLGGWSGIAGVTAASAARKKAPPAP